MQHTATHCNTHTGFRVGSCSKRNPRHTAVHCVAVSCNSLQHICNTLQLTATHTQDPEWEVALSAIRGILRLESNRLINENQATTSGTKAKARVKTGTHVVGPLSYTHMITQALLKVILRTLDIYIYTHTHTHTHAHMYAHVHTHTHLRT